MTDTLVSHGWSLLLVGSISSWKVFNPFASIGTSFCFNFSLFRNDAINVVAFGDSVSLFAPPNFISESEVQSRFTCESNSTIASLLTVRIPVYAPSEGGREYLVCLSLSLSRPFSSFALYLVGISVQSRWTKWNLWLSHTVQPCCLLQHSLAQWRLVPSNVSKSPNWDYRHCLIRVLAGIVLKLAAFIMGRIERCAKAKYRCILCCARKSMNWSFGVGTLCRFWKVCPNCLYRWLNLRP